MAAPRIIQHIFKEPVLEKVTQWELEKLVTDYPFFTGARMLLAKRAYQRSSDLQHEAVIRALLYTSAPHYLYQFIQSPPDILPPKAEAHPAAAETPAANETITAPPVNTFEAATHHDDLAEAGQLSVAAYEAIAASGENTLEPVLDTRELDTLETGHLSVDAYEALHADTASAPAPVSLDIHELDTLETGRISVDAYEAITEINTEAAEAPAQPVEATHPASPAEAILETTTGSFGTTAPELAIAFTQHITPADEQHHLSFREEMEAFRRELAARQEQEEADNSATAVVPSTPETPSPEEAPDAPASGTPYTAAATGSNDFQQRMETFRQSLLAAEDTAEEGATSQSVTEAEATILQRFNVHSFQDELEALKNSFTVTENTSENIAGTLETSAYAAAGTLKTTVIPDTENKEGLPDFVEETPPFPAATLAAEAATLSDHAPVFTSPSPADLPVENTGSTEQELNTADIQLVSDAINDQLPVSGSLQEQEDNTPGITTWMPQQRPSAEDIPGTHTAVTLPQAGDTESQAAAIPGATQENYEEGPIKIYPLEIPEETDLTFQPLYSEDYFAYKKLADPVAAETISEKGAQEMKSFTNWLRTMKDNFAEKTQKDWYHEQLHRVYEEEEESGISERVEKMALQSIILQDDIISETLAEIWARQRQHQKAIQIYKKLSLLNPAKSAYFAQKINELQSDINK